MTLQMYTNDELIQLILQHGGVVVKHNELSRRQLWNQLKCLIKPDAPSHWSYNSAYTRSDTLTEIMNSFQILYPKFEYLGTFSRRIESDGECNKRCLETMTSSTGNKKTFGCIMNTCEQRNECNAGHWVCLFCNIDKQSKLYGIHYYDSKGKPPTPEALDLMRSVAQIVNNPNKFKCVWNRQVHQRVEENCGIFCIAYLLHCIRGKTNFKTNDDGVQKIIPKLWKTKK